MERDRHMGVAVPHHLVGRHRDLQLAQLLLAECDGAAPEVLLRARVSTSQPASRARIDQAGVR